MPPKSGHQRAKNVDYDDDDIYSDEDEYYGEEEDGDGMTDEDREQLRLGTIKVKEALGSSISVSDKDIQDALWHYFYDVGKSVTYLKNKHAPAKPTAQPKKQKPASRFDQAASTASSELKSSSGSVYPCRAPDAMPSLDNFFWDTPWLNVPCDRIGTLTAMPTRPPGRLLGGSSKSSKLAALAAARKKKQEDAKQPPPKSLEDDSQAEAKKASALLDRLSMNGNTSGSGQKTSRSPTEELPHTRKYPLRRQVTSPQPVEQPEEPPTEPEQMQWIPVPDMRGSPSVFSVALCGEYGLPPKRQRLAYATHPIPYTVLRGYHDEKPFARPSPDDIVLTAQAREPKAKPAHKKAETDKLANSVEKLAVEEPKVKSKNLNVVEEFEKSGMKKMANFVVIGHVDHGKSTLMGRLLYDLKVIDQRSVDKLRKEAETIGKSSFALAWVMDQTSEERSRGVTVDIATNYFETDKTRFTILDAPGHKDFIPNMIAGASQADFAVLVIDASTNSFESGLKGQTKEHALLVRSMGVQRLVVAINKMDTVSWSQARYQEISGQMEAFLTQASFSGKSITFIPCAGLTGENVTKKVEDPNASWYTGESLIEALDSSEPAKRAIEKPLRLTVSDVFRGGITNPVSISGRIEAGSVQVGDSVLAMPANESATVKSIEVENEPVDWAIAGQIPTLHLADIDPVHLRLGDIMCDPKNAITLTKTFKAKILAFEHVMPMSVDVFRGRLQAEGKITKLEGVLNKGTGEVTKKKPRIVKPAEVARVVVELERELPLEAGVRVVLREGGNTVAAGLLEGV